MYFVLLGSLNNRNVLTFDVSECTKKKVLNFIALINEGQPVRGNKINFSRLKEYQEIVYCVPSPIWNLWGMKLSTKRIWSCLSLSLVVCLQDTNQTVIWCRYLPIKRFPGPCWTSSLSVISSLLSVSISSTKLLTVWTSVKFTIKLARKISREHENHQHVILLHHPHLQSFFFFFIENFELQSPYLTLNLTDQTIDQVWKLLFKNCRS